MSNLMKIVKTLFPLNLLLAGLLSANGYAATCILNPQSVKIPLMTLAVDPNADVGEELVVRSNSGLVNKTLVVGCTGGSSAYRSTSPLTPSTTYPGAYETGITGLGIIIGDLWNPGRTVEYSETIAPGPLTPWTIHNNVRLRFVKIGPIASGGSVGAKVVARYTLNGKPVADLTITGIRVIKKSCLVDVHSRRQTVNLGSPPKSEFSGVGSVANSSERPFKIKINCENDNIPVQLSFDALGTSPGVGMIDIQQQDQAAEGVAVEVLDSNRQPIKWGEEKTYHSKGEADITLSMIAHYKQTGAIKAGKANAAMTFTITQN